jgi:hypothetical protein
MRHERIPIEEKLKGPECRPCTPAFDGAIMGMPNVKQEERLSMNLNAASTSAALKREGGGGQEMDWLMEGSMDDPLTSFLHMEQEGQGNNSDFGALSDELFGVAPPNPSGMSSFGMSSGGHGHGGGVKPEAKGGHAGDSNSSGNSGTSDCTGAPGQFTIGAGSSTRVAPGAAVGESEATLTRPFANSALRQAQLQRYRAKRLARHLGHKKIRYECRKTLADNRPRIKGRFAKVNSSGNLTAAQSCPNLTALEKNKAKPSGADPAEDKPNAEGSKQSSGDSNAPGAATKGRKSRLSGGSDANSGLPETGIDARGKNARGGRRHSGEQMSENTGTVGNLRSGNHRGLPYTQSEVSLVALDRAGW